MNYQVQIRMSTTMPESNHDCYGYWNVTGDLQASAKYSGAGGLLQAQMMSLTTTL